MLQVMIVDDMEIVRREMKRFKLWGDETGFVIAAEARNGHEALEKLHAAPVDLVLTDIRMPKIDGIELLKKITEEKLCPCVVLLSDYSEFSYARQGLVLGAFDYMVKPMTEEELERLLHRVREFILDKRNEQNRIRQLEQKLGERVAAFFPQPEVNRVVEAMAAGEAKAAEYAAHMADIVYASLDRDLIKSQSLLNSIMHEMAGRIQENYGWLNRFISVKEMEAVDFSTYDDFCSARESFVAAVQRITELLGKLLYCVRENGTVYKVCSYVAENIDGEISLKTVSDRLFMNKSYLSEVFKSKTGISFIEYLTIVKMERAKKLIGEERLKNYEVAELLGFKDIEYFSRLFKKHAGASPTEYRQRSMEK